MNRGSIALWVGVAVMTAYFLLPLYVLFLIAFNPARYTIEALYPSLLFERPTLENFVLAFTQYNFVSPFLRSASVATLVGFFSVALGIPAGYGLGRLSSRVAYPLLVLILITNMMPGIVVAVPISTEFIRLRLFDSVLGLALVQTLVTLPLAIFIMQGTFSSIPREIEYQARLDGGTFRHIITKVLIPVALPGIIAAFLISWMFSWDEFTYAVILSPIKPTLPVEIYYSITRGNLLTGVAFSLIFTVPVIVLTVVLQRYLKGEYLAGGVVR
jgi:trehalose transport system permease protein